jgi:hypothetical protein
MAELSIVASVLGITSPALSALHGISVSGGNYTTVQLQVQLWTHDAAAKKLRNLLTTDIKNRLSQADLASIDNLCKSSLVLSSTIYVGIADRKRKLNTSLTLSLIKYTTDLTRHIEDECKKLEG